LWQLGDVVKAVPPAPRRGIGVAIAAPATPDTPAPVPGGLLLSPPGNRAAAGSRLGAPLLLLVERELPVVLGPGLLVRDLGQLALRDALRRGGAEHRPPPPPPPKQQQAAAAAAVATALVAVHPAAASTTAAADKAAAAGGWLRPATLACGDLSTCCTPATRAVMPPLA
jgi:hypothetical protein